MGSGASRLQAEEQLPRPLHHLLRSRAEEARRRRMAAARFRHSIVSTTELLDSGSSADSDEAGPHLPPAPEEGEAAAANERRGEGDEDGRRLRKGRRGGSAGEELPGSPSFRVYCVDDDAAAAGRGGGSPEDSTVKFVRLHKEDKLQEMVGKMKEKHDNFSAKDTGPITPAKQGRRLRVLTKAHIATSRWLNCYNKVPSASPHDSPRLLTIKEGSD